MMNEKKPEEMVMETATGEESSPDSVGKCETSSDYWLSDYIYKGTAV